MIKNKCSLTIGVLMFPLLATANTSSIKALNWTMENIILVLGFFILMGAILALYSILRTMIANQHQELLREKGIEPVEETAPKRNFFERMYSKAWSMVPVSNEEAIDMGHDYDGIRELDNRLPPWWLWMFYLTIAFSAGYLYVYHFSDIGISQEEEYQLAMKRGEEQRQRFLAMQGSNIDEDNLVLVSDEAELSTAKTIYIANCAACHGQLGEGGVGPNLTDGYWLHGGDLSSIFKVIKYGVPEKGMIAWSAQLKPKTMAAIASYITTLHDTNPPNAKEKEGELYVPEANDGDASEESTTPEENTEAEEAVKVAG